MSGSENSVRKRLSPRVMEGVYLSPPVQGVFLCEHRFSEPDIQGSGWQHKHEHRINEPALLAMAYKLP